MKEKFYFAFNATHAMAGKALLVPAFHKAEALSKVERVYGRNVGVLYNERAWRHESRSRLSFMKVVPFLDK